MTFRLHAPMRFARKGRPVPPYAMRKANERSGTVQNRPGGKRMKRKMWYEQLFLAAAFVITIVVWFAGATFFPRTRVMIVSALVFLTLVAWFVDAIVKSVKRRMRAQHR